MDIRVIYPHKIKALNLGGKLLICRWEDSLEALKRTQVTDMEALEGKEEEIIVWENLYPKAGRMRIQFLEARS